MVKTSSTVRNISRNSPCAIEVLAVSATAKFTSVAGMRPRATPAAAIAPRIWAAKMNRELHFLVRSAVHIGAGEDPNEPYDWYNTTNTECQRHRRIEKASTNSEEYPHIDCEREAENQGYVK